MEEITSLRYRKMKNLTKYTEQQLEWFRLKGLCILAKYQIGKERSEAIEKLHLGVKAYFEQYQIKFDYGNMPE